MALKGHYALCYANHASFVARHGNLKEGRCILLTATMWPTFRRYKVHADVRGCSVASVPQRAVGSPEMHF